MEFLTTNTRQGPVLNVFEKMHEVFVTSGNCHSCLAWRHIRCSETLPSIQQGQNNSSIFKTVTMARTDSVKGRCYETFVPYSCFCISQYCILKEVRSYRNSNRQKSSEKKETHTSEHVTVNVPVQFHSCWFAM